MKRLAAWRESLHGEPGLLRLAAVVLVITAVALGAVTNRSLDGMRVLVTTIGRDSAPSVVLAGQIRESLASMDVNAVNGYLPGAPKDAYAELEDHKETLVAQLMQAADNVTFGESELAPIRALISGLADYMGYARAANMMGYPDGIPAQLKASQLLHQQLLPAGEELDRANLTPLEASARYVEEHDFSLGMKLIGWSLVAMLAAVQVIVAIRFRRVFNPPIALAFVLLLVMLWRVDTTLESTQATLREGVQDAFISSHAISKARALAKDANGDESLYLLNAGDPAAQAYAEEAFKEKITHLFSGPVTTRVRDQFVAAFDRHEKLPYDGYFADAMNNVTFEGEEKLALMALDALKRYLEVDSRVRDLERAGQHAQAIQLALGNNPGESNYAFDELDRSLAALSKLNQLEFERRITDVRLRLRDAEILAGAIPALVAFLCFIGLRIRIKEFA